MGLCELTIYLDKLVEVYKSEIGWDPLLEQATKEIKERLQNKGGKMTNEEILTQRSK